MVELRGLVREELNGLRGVCLAQREDMTRRARVGVRLASGRELSVAAANTTALLVVGEVAGKGLGAKAGLRVRTGELLLRETPVLFGSEGVPDRRKLTKLSQAQQASVLTLWDAYADVRTDVTLEGILATNGLPRAPGSEETVLCLLASRLNHSCRPNAEYLWVETLQVEEVRAIRDIEQGEEVCVNYIGDDVRHPTPVRRARLRQVFRFDCMCVVCLQVDVSSDARRARLVQLDREILACRERPREGLCLVEEVLRLLQLEGLRAPRTTAQVYNDGFELAVMVGDQSEVRRWAVLSYYAHRDGWGEDYPITKRMKLYAQEPPVQDVTAVAKATQMLPAAEQEVSKVVECGDAVLEIQPSWLISLD